jgi:hypothetical protein
LYASLELPELIDFCLVKLFYSETFLA